MHRVYKKGIKLNERLTMCQCSRCIFIMQVIVLWTPKTLMGLGKGLLSAWDMKPSASHNKQALYTELQSQHIWKGMVSKDSQGQ